MSSKIPLNPAATFDCLFVARRLQHLNGSFSIPELHIFGYLACLLWLYRNQPISDWGYTFVGTELGAPFSQDIDTAANEFLEHGLFHRTHEHLKKKISTEISLNQKTQTKQISFNFNMA